MNSRTDRFTLAGPAGALQCALDRPAAQPVGLAVLCHPHPQFAGTMDNKVVQTLARACVQAGWRALRFNFRGVGESAGQWDEGQGEVEDALSVIAAQRQPGESLLLGGFSFGGYVAAQAASRLPVDARPAKMLLVAPATRNFALPQVPQDTLVIHGEADDVVPLSATLDWARPQILPVVVVPAVGHFFHGQLPLLKSLLLRHLGA